ncbi:unnamed protein product [Effrenium voratum]|uniref:Carboxylic ester hydrolase n=1 Tax=Effrenium voratum TaxID=2562239 RepID=A0AA36HTD8_9DINO|nr:unnamed protein product [Effrenium voratum]
MALPALAITALLGWASAATAAAGAADAAEAPPGQIWPEVRAPAGRLRGAKRGQLHVFLGVPYAEPPLGSRRWRPPTALPAWEGLRDATKYGDYCMQEEGGSEDCLYLNVFMPEEAQNLTGLPCMVWIHGGAYESGKSDLYDPSNITELLRSKGLPAILVTINYRLNVFGFLGSGSLATRDATGSTGNYGIQDQRMALQWVQNNIAAFGGDPQKVMIFGQSAGAGSVSMHLAMPASQDLFSSALMESGGFSGWSAQPMKLSEQWYSKLLNQTGCPDVACLLALPADQLRAAYLQIPHGRCCEDLMGNAFIPWAPTVDGVELAQHPLDLAKAGKVNRVPTVIGTNMDDGASWSLDYNQTESDFKAMFAKQYGSAAAAEVYLNASHPRMAARSDGWWAYDRAVTDQNFFCSTLEAAKGLQQPVFQYLFNFSDSRTPVVQHSDELPFVFKNLPSDATGDEESLSEEVLLSWYRLAAFGNPGNPKRPWPSATQGSLLLFQTAAQGGSQVLKSDSREKACEFMGAWLSRDIHRFDQTVVVV